MKRFIFATLLLAGTSASTPAQAQAFECTGSIASIAVAAADSVISMLGGGRASQIAQALQIKEAVIANFCAASMNDQLTAINDYEMRNIAHGMINGFSDINGTIARAKVNLEHAGFMLLEDYVRGQMETTYPVMFPPMTGSDLETITWDMTVQERQAQMNATAIQNRSVQEGVRSLERGRDHAAAGKAGQGLRAELQANNAIANEQLAALNALTATTVAAQRAELERRLRDEAKTAAANARADDYMASLGVCANCGINRAILE